MSIRFDGLVMGTPELLVLDNGLEFHSAPIQAYRMEPLRHGVQSGPTALAQKQQLSAIKESNRAHPRTAAYTGSLPTP